MSRIDILSPTCSDHFKHSGSSWIWSLSTSMILQDIMERELTRPLDSATPFNCEDKLKRSYQVYALSESWKARAFFVQKMNHLILSANQSFGNATCKQKPLNLWVLFLSFSCHAVGKRAIGTLGATSDSAAGFAFNQLASATIKASGGHW